MVISLSYIIFLMSCVIIIINKVLEKIINENKNTQCIIYII